MDTGNVVLVKKILVWRRYSSLEANDDDDEVGIVYKGQGVVYLDLTKSASWQLNKTEVTNNTPAKDAPTPAV